MSHEVVSQTVVVAAGQSADVGGDVHPVGGAPKVVEFRRAEDANSPETAVGGAPKVAEFRREYGELGSATSELAISNVPAAEHVDTRALVLGVGRPAPPGKLGRPITVTPAVAEQVCMLISIGFSRRQAAAYLGLSTQAIARAMERDPDFGRELQRAQELSSLQPELTLMAEARKNWRAAAWYLTFKAKNPPPPSEEEKEARHQAKLADERRTAAEMRAFMDGMREPATEVGPLPGMPKVVRKPRRGR